MSHKNTSFKLRKALNVNIIKMDLKETGRAQQNGLIWFSTETNGKLLWTR